MASQGLKHESLAIYDIVAWATEYFVIYNPYKINRQSTKSVCRYM
jgi:hypothetical protein